MCARSLTWLLCCVVAVEVGAGCGDNQGGEIGPAAPTSVAASDGTSSEFVAVTWAAALGATGYDVYRDEILVAGNIAATSYEDDTATAGGASGAPTNLAASDGTRSTEVRLIWSAAVAPEGAIHRYTVRAKSEAGTSVDSIADTGYRGAFAVTGYDVYRDGTVIATNVASTSYDDTAATAGSAPLAPTNLAASDGIRTDDVRLTWTAAVAPDGAMHNYSVRANSTGGPSTDDTGYRGASPVSSYEYSLDGATWASAGAASPFDDTSAPAGSITPGLASASDGTFKWRVNVALSGASASVGASRTYRVRALNEVGASLSSNTDTGNRGSAR